MKATLSLLNAVILALIATSISPSEGAPTSAYSSCKDGTSLCIGLGTTSEISANSSSCLTTEHCTFFFKSTFNSQTGFTFSLNAPSLPADRYIAVALSNETGMAGLVTQCFHNSVSSKNVIEFSFNAGYHNQPIADQRSVTGFTGQSATYNNGGLTCSWTAPANGKISYKGHEDFDLLSGSYYLKLATGAVNASTGAIHRHAMHDASGRVASSSSVNLSKTKGIIVAKEVHHKAPPSPGTGPFPQDSSLYESSPYDKCKDNSALCFGIPEGCSAKGNCNFFFRSTYSSSSGFTFSLIAPSIQSDHYIAVAFSPKSGMSGLVVQCFHAPSGANTLQYSFNKDYDNELITDPAKDLKGFSHQVTNYQNGQLNCQWNVPVGGKVTYKDNSFDFEHNQYFLKVATGAVKGGAISKHSHDGRLVSKTALSLKATGTVHGGGGASLAIKWHGK